MKRMKKRKITVLAGVILCVIAGCLVKRMTAVYTQKENPIGPERGTTDVFLTAADFISEKSDQELLQEIETFDTDKAEMIYLYIPEDTGAGMSFAITRRGSYRRRWTKFSRPFTEKKFPARSQNRYST